MKNGSENTSPISFLCPPELRKGIEEIAASEGISHSDVIRRAVLFDVRRRKAADPQPEETRPHPDAVD